MAEYISRDGFEGPLWDSINSKDSIVNDKGKRTGNLVVLLNNIYKKEVNTWPYGWTNDPEYVQLNKDFSDFIKDLRKNSIEATSAYIGKINDFLKELEKGNSIKANVFDVDEEMEKFTDNGSPKLKNPVLDRLLTDYKYPTQTEEKVVLR